LELFTQQTQLTRQPFVLAFISTFGGTFGEFKAITPYPEQRARFENISLKATLFYAGNLKI